ncbi:P-loop containing nucleoside triphosphate hydrolase protein [Radiomyces spectabilis]|uniref:P-loop containing nucleoside triphosphate hydrolase protein n=1 Tax=Radiomyces spectabilis TaxID=64574 RepID=UPI00222004A9|nr:P-loop containing nucleoside triphosphate hydrolase protein [Radiomyces spectabilis]KAI8365355.1 P-loop containing nucleoside triphosphate hydrolase protein [Radiomyces spectabilis]
MRHDFRDWSNSLWNKSAELGALPPEVDDEGNIEYKLKLVNPSFERLEQLITQMKWRLSEGDGEAMYEIGVDDDGTFIGLSREDMSASLATLRKMADALNADVSIVREIVLDRLAKVVRKKPTPGYVVIEALIRKRPSDKLDRFTDIRIAIVGGDGAGKSSLLGRLTYGINDNGRGRARLNLLRHRHEIESGKTSSIAHEIMGYDSEGNTINYTTNNVSSWEHICELSSKIITFLDTCGHPKYLRTTIAGLTGYAPDYACLVISATTAGLSDMTREHLSLAVMLDVPVFVVITKIDIATPDQLRHTLTSLLGLLKAPWMRKIPLFVRSKNDVMLSAPHFARHGPEVPIFLVSNVSSDNIHHVEQFFNLLPKPARAHEQLLEEPVEFQIEEVYSLPDVGIVIGGMLRKGRINIKEPEEQRTYHLGPDAKGHFIRVTVSSIHRHRVPCHYIHCGQTATLAIQSPDLVHWPVSKGMTLLGMDTPESYFEFEADMIVLYHPTGVTKGTSGMIHMGSIRQRAQITSISIAHKENEKAETGLHTSLSTPTFYSGSSSTDVVQSSRSSHVRTQSTDGDTATSGHHALCIFRFLYKPVYLHADAQILFVEGKAKCLGRITRVIPRTRSIDTP